MQKFLTNVGVFRRYVSFGAVRNVYSFVRSYIFSFLVFLSPNTSTEMSCEMTQKPDKLKRCNKNPDDFNVEFNSLWSGWVFCSLTIVSNSIKA